MKAAFAAASAVLSLASAPTASSTQGICDLGPPIAEKVVLRPKPGTFYSVDTLNPDIVRAGRRYLLFFSGNSVGADAGTWRTGLAEARSPLGPFHVIPDVSEPFLNGGTARVENGLIHGATLPGRRGPVLYTSASGRRWREITEMPSPEPPAWRLSQFDLSLDANGGGA